MSKVSNNPLVKFLLTAVFLGPVAGYCNASMQCFKDVTTGAASLSNATEEMLFLSVDEYEVTEVQNVSAEIEVKVPEDMAQVHFNATDIVLGNRDANVVVVEYFSPTCPHCAHFHKHVYPKLETKYISTKKIAYVIREFVGNKQDLEASILARCAGDMRRLSIHSKLLDMQLSWAFGRDFHSELVKVAKQSGINPDDFERCLKDDSITNILMSNARYVALQQGFAGTPCFLINSKLMRGANSYEDISAAIDAALTKS